MNNISLYIALRYWRAKSADRFGRLVTNLASTGIVLGVMALIIVLSIMNGLENMQKRQVLATIPHAVVMNNEGYFNLQNDAPKLPPFVQKAVPINTTGVILQSAAGVSAGQIIGVRSFTDDDLLNGLADQPFDDFLPAGKFNLVLGSRLAEKLKLQPGDKVRLMITENSQYTPFGRVPSQRLFTVSGIYFDASEAADYEIFANLADIGRLMRIQTDRFQGYRLFLNDPFQITALADYFPSAQWKLSDWRAQKGEFFQAVGMEKNMMGLLISLIIVVAVSNIVTSLSLMVVDKQGEIAILQTQGLNKKQVRRIFIFQGLLVGLAGTLIGTVLGVSAALNLDTVLQYFNSQQIRLPVEIHPPQIIGIVGFSLLLALLSTVYPAYRAAETQPAEALRYE